MIAISKNWRRPTIEPGLLPPGGRLAGRVRHYFARHPEVSREEFLLEALARELALREGPDAEAVPLNRPLTEEDLRLHARLNERLAALNYERYGLWPRLRRLLFDNWLVRRLVSENSVV